MKIAVYGKGNKLCRSERVYDLHSMDLSCPGPRLVILSEASRGRFPGNRAFTISGRDAQSRNLSSCLCLHQSSRISPRLLLRGILRSAQNDNSSPVGLARCGGSRHSALKSLQRGFRDLVNAIFLDRNQPLSCFSLAIAARTLPNDSM